MQEWFTLFQNHNAAFADAGAAEPSPVADESSASALLLESSAALTRQDVSHVDAIPFGRSGSQHSLAPSSNQQMPTDEGDDESLTFFENGLTAGLRQFFMQNGP